MKPDKIFVLSVSRNHKLIVYIWPTLKAMRGKLRKLTGTKGESGTIAFFHAPRARIGPHNVVLNKVVGQIHLVKGRFGAGIFAHELQHFISWWSTIKNYELIGKDWERVPGLAGNLTSRFWNLFYKKHKD